MSSELAESLLVGAYEFHTHPAPSHRDRKYDDFEYLQALDARGMAGAVVKNHFSPTAARVALANRHAGAKARLFGSVTLDWPAGGLNPYAVESELLLGARVVWLPTFHAQNWLDRTGPVEPIPGTGIRVVDEKGRLKPDVFEIIALVKKHDAVLCTGHISVAESLALCAEARSRNVDTVLTHPDSYDENVPADVQEHLASRGVFLEKCWINLFRNETTIAAMAGIISRVGAERCVLCTDLGNRADAGAPEGMAVFIDALLNQGVSARAIATMAAHNPGYLLRV